MLPPTKESLSTDNSCEYVAISDSSDSTETHSNEISHNRRTYKGMTCCLVTVLIGLTLYLLIPRSSHFVLYHITYTQQGSVTGHFEVKNINLYWIPYNGQTVGPICYNNNTCDSNIYIDGMCAIKLGKFSSNKKISTAPKQNKKIEIKMLNNTPEQLACTMWMLGNPFENLAQRLMSTGNVKTKSIFTKFNTYRLPHEYYYLS